MFHRIGPSRKPNAPIPTNHPVCMYIYFLRLATLNLSLFRRVFPAYDFVHPDCCSTGQERSNVLGVETHRSNFAKWLIVEIHGLLSSCSANCSVRIGVRVVCSTAMRQLDIRSATWRALTIERWLEKTSTYVSVNDGSVQHILHFNAAPPGPQDSN